MVRNFYPPRMDMPWPTIPWPTFQNRSTPSDASDAPNQNSYTPGQSAYSANRRQGGHTQRQSQNAYTPSQSTSYRPNNATYNPSTTSNSHSTPRNYSRDVQNQVLDDQIAPSATSHSISALQRFALATASIPTYPPRYNEVQIIERIEKRYGAGREDGRPRYGGGFGESGDKERKRGRDLVEEDKMGVSSGKRRRIGDGKEEVIDLTIGNDDEREGEKESDYAESSEWSWPGDGK